MRSGELNATLDTIRWVSIRSDVLGALFTAGLSIYLVYGKQQASASVTGFSLTLACESFLFLVRSRLQ